MGKERFLSDGEEKAVYQKYQNDSGPQIYDSQGDGSGFIQRHGGQRQRIAGGENRLIPGSRCGTVHQGDHYQREEELDPYGGQERIDQKLNAAAD